MQIIADGRKYLLLFALLRFAQHFLVMSLHSARRNSYSRRNQFAQLSQ